MAAKTTMSIDEFLKLPPETAQGVHYELDEGELIRLSPSGKTHAAIVLRVGSYLDQLLPADRFTVLVGEAGIILDSSSSTPTIRGADVAVVENDTLDDTYARKPFVIAVEVVSRNHDAEDLERKTHQYLAAGVKEVWLIYPSTGSIYVHQIDGTAARYARGASFHSPALAATVDSERFFSR
jgi:Uma2 family endonuclease